MSLSKTELEAIAKMDTQTLAAAMSNLTLDGYGESAYCKALRDEYLARDPQRVYKDLHPKKYGTQKATPVSINVHPDQAEKVREFLK